MGTAVSEYDFATNNWISNLTTFPGGLNPDAGFVINDIIYLCSQQGNNFFAYNPITNTFTQKANYPGAANRRGGIAFDINGKGYFGSGTTYFNNGCGSSTIGCFTPDFYEYNPATNTWTTKASLPSNVVFGVGASHNGKGYAGTGEAYYSPSIGRYKVYDWYEYNTITNLWTAKQNFMNGTGIFALENISNSSIAVLGDDIYLFGGWGYSVTNKLKDNVYKYSTTTNNWSAVDYDLGKNRTEASGFFVNGKVYVGGGQDSEGLNDFWEYDITTNNWVQKASFPTVHAQRACAEINGKGYFIGGYTTSLFNTVANPNAIYTDNLLEYDSSTNVFNTKAPYPAGKRGGMTTFEYNGKLYAGQGYNIGQPTNEFYEYNLVTNTWAQKNNTPFTGGNLSSFRIGNIGYVLQFNPQPVLAKYNFDTNIWTTETHNIPIPNANFYNNQAFTYNGIGYIVTGNYDAPHILYKYNPTISTWAQVTNLPFKSPSQTIIPANNGIYFGFGNASVNHPIGLSNTNDWRFMKLDAIVSDKYGKYESKVNVAYQGQIICGTGQLFANASHSVYDTNGDLFTSVICASGQTSSACYEVTSVDLAIPFKTATREFGSGFVETAMFLNKSVTFPVNNALGGDSTFRLYYTTAELNKLVTDFNTLYNTNKTIADIKIVRYIDFANILDANPLNNTNGIYGIYSSTIANYGTDKYFDKVTSNSSPATGEIYAVILAGSNLANESFSKTKINIYPNPATSTLNIKLSDNSEINKITITDLSGKKILEQVGNSNAINIENLAKGMYVIEAIVGDRKLVEKFIKN